MSTCQEITSETDSRNQQEQSTAGNFGGNRGDAAALEEADFDTSALKDSKEEKWISLKHFPSFTFVDCGSSAS